MTAKRTKNEQIPKARKLSLRRVFGGIGNMLSRVLYPSNIKCLCCGRDLQDISNIEICSKCMADIHFIDPSHACQKCGASLTGIGKYCQNCMDAARDFDIGASVAVYEDKIQKMIHDLKFGQKPYIHRTIAHLMALKLSQLEWDFDVIVPVPMTRERLKQRGYNQSLLIAECLSKILNKPLYNILTKIKDTPDQVGLNYKERQQNLVDSIKCNENMTGKTALLVDDVMTTGATANACSVALKKAKATNVFVITLGHGVVKIHTENNDENK